MCARVCAQTWDFSPSLPLWLGCSRSQARSSHFMLCVEGGTGVERRRHICQVGHGQGPLGALLRKMLPASGRIRLLVQGPQPSDSVFKELVFLLLLLFKDRHIQGFSAFYMTPQQTLIFLSGLDQISLSPG